MRPDGLQQLPADLPVPVDDGAANHLAGRQIPLLNLPATDGASVDLSTIGGRVVVFAYPRTGQPGAAPLVADWDMIPGARGCTPQACSFRNLSTEFSALSCKIFD